MSKNANIERIATGVRNLDSLVNGGLPGGSVVVISGPPGAGKTILTQQICFHNASPEHRVLYFSTLSEPTSKTLRYLNQFSFFDAAKLETEVQFVDLGVLLRAKGLAETSKLIMEQLRRVKPAIVVIDSFKVFDDLAKSPEELRKFGYELAVNLMAWETTAFLLGEYSPRDVETNPLFSIVDGLIQVAQREQSGEQQRFIQIIKMRGIEHSRDEYPFVISRNGIEVFAPRVTIQREARADLNQQAPRLKTGISKLDDLLGEGIPRGSSVLIGGVAGTGKTVLLLEFLFRGAQAGEKGIIFSFEETEERLRATARGLGWDLDREIERGMVEIVFIPQPNIMVEQHLLMIRERVQALGAQRVAVDSVSVFLHKIRDPQFDREKIFQLASIVQNTQAVGFFATDIPYGSGQLSRFGVEETVVDGVILLTLTEEGLERQRYLEVYKLRNTAHLKGRHSMVIGPGGIKLFPRYGLGVDPQTPPPPVDPSRRLAFGVPGLDELLGGGVLERSATLISGSAGTGKSTLALQFILAGVKRKEPGVYVSLEEGPAQIIKTAESLGLDLEAAVKAKLVEIVYFSRHHVRANQYIALLADVISARKARRLVVDGMSQMVAEGISAEELKQLLVGLISQLKSLGVTSVFTVEASSMHAGEFGTERGFSPIADNLIALRYERAPGELLPLLTVVKTRGSAHDRGIYYITVGRGGVRIGQRISEPALREKKKPAAPRREKRSR